MAKSHYTTRRPIKQSNNISKATSATAKTKARYSPSDSKQNKVKTAAKRDSYQNHRN
jgi:hypothetical protein